jgi:hypothetical protein
LLVNLLQYRVILGAGSGRAGEIRTLDPQTPSLVR